jgi:formate-dependent nitrite reductase membrane component NrfD
VGPDAGEAAGTEAASRALVLGGQDAAAVAEVHLHRRLFLLLLLLHICITAIAIAITITVFRFLFLFLFFFLLPIVLHLEKLLPCHSLSVVFLLRRAETLIETLIETLAAAMAACRGEGYSLQFPKP